MANPGQAPGTDEQSVESRRSTVPQPDPSEPVSPDGEAPPSDLPDFGELAPESARPTPLDDIVEAEREQLPRD